MSTNQDVKDKIDELIDRGMTDKSEIYSVVVEELKVPRPTVRRVARELREQYLKRVEVLQQDLTPNSIGKGKQILA